MTDTTTETAGQPQPTQTARWRPHETVSGDVLDLSHLDTYHIVFQTKAGGAFQVKVEFSHHCFTRAVEDTDTPDMRYQGAPRQDPRTFDTDRYVLSKDLRGYIAGLMEGKCLHTGRDNFFVVRVVTYDGKVRDYEIYFRVYLSKNPRGLTMQVQSAYLRDPDRLATRTHQGPIHFGVILANVNAGKPIRTAYTHRRKI